jgi:hypothetical protein
VHGKVQSFAGQGQRAPCASAAVAFHATSTTVAIANKRTATQTDRRSMRDLHPEPRPAR